MNLVLSHNQLRIHLHLEPRQLASSSPSCVALKDTRWVFPSKQLRAPGQEGLEPQGYEKINLTHPVPGSAQGRRSDHIEAGAAPIRHVHIDIYYKSSKAMMIEGSGISVTSRCLERFPNDFTFRSDRLVRMLEYIYDLE